MAKNLQVSSRLQQKNPYADPSELPKPSHVAKMVRASDRMRDKPFMMTLWSTSARIGAILGLRWKDIRFDRIARVKFRETKTGDNRTVPVASAFPYLKKHKELDSRGDEPDAFVFRSLQTDGQLSYNGAYGIIEKACEEAGIPEKIKANPHAWRKGKITELARRGWGEAQISKVSGRVIGSDEIRIYSRLGSEDIDSVVKQEAGLDVQEEKEENPLKPKKCPNKACNRLNAWENEVCSSCGEPISEGELFRKVKEEETEKRLSDEKIASEYAEKFTEENREYFQEVFENSEIEADEYLEEVGRDPRNWFPAKVGRLFENGFSRMGFIASNVYAESVIDFWLENLNKFRTSNNVISDKEAEKLSESSYSNKLKVFRQLGIIDDSTYGTLDRLNSSRNDFAHDIDSHKPEYETEIEKEISDDELVKLIDSLFEKVQEGFIEWVSSSLGQSS